MWGMAGSMAEPNLKSGTQRLAAAAGLMLLATLFGLSLDPILGDAGAYASFYPAVAIAAVGLGRGCALGVSALSAAIGHLCLDQPRWTAKFEPEALVSLLLFLTTAAAMIWMVERIRRGVREQVAARHEAEGRAQDHFDLFCEINERVANHLQLVAGLLQAHARDERGRSMEAFAEASARTMLISRLHRHIAGSAPGDLPFHALAQRLASTAVAGQVDLRVEVTGGELHLPPDQATSAALLLLECIKARLASNASGLIRVNLGTEAHLARIEMTEAGTETAAWPSPLNLHFIEAMVEQLGGDFRRRADENGSTAALVFPRYRPLADESAVAATLH